MASLLEAAYDVYDGQCTCGDLLVNNCGHYVTNALIKAGFTELDGGSAPREAEEENKLEDRASLQSEEEEEEALPLPTRVSKGYTVCKSGRPVLAKEIHERFFKKYGTASLEEPKGICAAYQEQQSDGMGHVLLIHGSDYRGTGDFREFDGWTTTYYEFK